MLPAKISTGVTCSSLKTVSTHSQNFPQKPEFFVSFTKWICWAKMWETRLLRSVKWTFCKKWTKGLKLTVLKPLSGTRPFIVLGPKLFHFCCPTSRLSKKIWKRSVRPWMPTRWCFLSAALFWWSRTMMLSSTRTSIVLRKSQISSNSSSYLA